MSMFDYGFIITSLLILYGLQKHKKMHKPFSRKMNRFIVIPSIFLTIVLIYWWKVVYIWKILVTSYILLEFIRLVSIELYTKIYFGIFRFYIIIFMVFISGCAFIVATLLVPYLMEIIGIDIGLVNLFSIFEKNEEVLKGNVILLSIALIFPPALYLYQFSKLCALSLVERWFKHKAFFKYFSIAYDERILLVNLTIITTFLGFLPLLIDTSMHSVEIKKTINQSSLTILIGCMLPTFDLLIKSTKH